MTKRLLLAIAALVIPTLAYAGILLGPLSSGSVQTPPVTGTAPVVSSLTCDIALPIISQNVVLAGGGTCNYIATCNATPCGGMDAITSWAITAQSTANSFAITNAGLLKGGSASSSVTTGAYTVTVTATNATGTSPPVVQTVNAFTPPVVAAHACNIKSPISNGVNVVLQAGGDCQYTASCGGVACAGADAITAWTVTSQTCTACYQVTSGGVLQGGANAANIVNTTSTVSLTATNAAGTSPIVAETVTAITVPTVSNKNFSRTLPMVFPDTIGTMTATANPASWAITAVSGDGAGPTDFAISNSGVLTTTANAVTDITGAGVVTITVTATNATGTSAPATATLNVVSNPPPLVQSKTCNVNPPVTNGVAVSPSCTFTATCGGGSCIAPYAITGWNIVSQTHANGFTITSGGVLQGGTNGAATTGANTVTVTATNSVATSPAVGETVNVAGIPPVVTNGNYVQTLTLVAGNLSPAMTATCAGVACSGANAITSWAVTGASGNNAQVRDFSITNGGVLAMTSFAPTDITTAGITTINVSATNIGGTGTGTATLTVNAATAGLPAGVTLQAIDGETMTSSTVMSHNYYTRNGFSVAANAGFNGKSWDDPTFIPMGSFLSTMNGSNQTCPSGTCTTQAIWADLGWNTQWTVDSSYVSSVARAAGIWAVGGGPSGACDGGASLQSGSGVEIAGWYTFDEPTTYAIATDCIRTTSNALSNTRFFQTTGTINNILSGPPSGTPGAGNMTAFLFTNVATPNATPRHFDLYGNDVYFYAYDNFTQLNVAKLFNVSGQMNFSVLPTNAQMRRGSNYGDYVDALRRSGLCGDGGAGGLIPLSAIIETGGPFPDSGAIGTYIQPRELDWAVWQSLIHGARGIDFFDHSFGGPSAANNNMYDSYYQNAANYQGGVSMYAQVKSTVARVKSHAAKLQSPTAIGYATVNPPSTEVDLPPCLLETTAAPAGTNVLHVAAVPGWVQNGLKMISPPNNGIPATATVTGKTATTITLSQNITNTVQAGDYFVLQGIGAWNTGFDIVSKYVSGTFYIFASARAAETATNISATFTVNDPGATSVTVLDESRSIPIVGGQFTDNFATAYAVHIYQVNH